MSWIGKNNYLTYVSHARSCIC